MFEQLRQLIESLQNMPRTMDELRLMAEAIALYGKIAFVIAAFAGIVWVLRLPILAVVNILRYKEMRTIDREETEASEMKNIIEVAKAQNGGNAVTKTEFMAAIPVYHEMVKLTRESRKKHL